MAVITHFEYEEYLEQSISSLCHQSHKLNAIVVLDDASKIPPTHVVRKFDDVTLLTSETNCGPYMLLEAILNQTNFDCYLLQDADDWSASNRLEMLLNAAELFNADMVGCQAVNVFDHDRHEQDIVYPFDVLSALMDNPISHPMLVATSLISKSLIDKVGGLSSGLRFGADSEFMRRAVFAGKLINVQDTGYFRRIHKRSLTSSPFTGFGSPARLKIQTELQQRSRDNVERVKLGQQPLLEPIRKNDNQIKLTHVAGPRL